MSLLFSALYATCAFLPCIPYATPWTRLQSHARHDRPTSLGCVQPGARFTGELSSKHISAEQRSYTEPCRRMRWHGTPCATPWWNCSQELLYYVSGNGSTMFLGWRPMAYAGTMTVYRHFSSTELYAVPVSRLSSEDHWKRAVRTHSCISTLRIRLQAEACMSFNA